MAEYKSKNAELNPPEPELNPSAEKRNAVSPEMNGIGGRINAIAQSLGGKRALSKSIGIHETQIYRYTTEAALPGASTLVNIAREGGVHLDWLCEGNGPKWRDDSGPGAGQPGRQARATQADAETESLKSSPGDLEAITDMDLLAEIMEVLDQVLEAEERDIPYARKAVLTVLLYDYYRKGGDERITPDQASQFFRIYKYLNKDTNFEGMDESEIGGTQRAV